MTLKKKYLWSFYVTVGILNYRASMTGRRLDYELEQKKLKGTGCALRGIILSLHKIEFGKSQTNKKSVGINRALAAIRRGNLPNIGLQRYCNSNQMTSKIYKMGETCGTHWRENQLTQGFGRKPRR